MKKQPEKIADNLIMAILIHTNIGWGAMFMLVSLATIHLAYNAYLGLILPALLILLFTWLMYDLAKIFPGKNISTIFSYVFSKPLGKIISIFYLFFLFFFLTFALKRGQLMVYTYFFRRTPFFLPTTVLMAVALYLALKGVKSIGRLAAFMLFPPFLIFLVLQLIGQVNVNPLNIRPVLSGTPSQWVMGGMDLMMVFLPVATLVNYLPFIKKPKCVLKIGLSSLGLVFPLFFLTLLGTIGVYGPNTVKKISWPLVEYIHILDYPYLLLEQAGLFYLLAWYAFAFIALTQGLFIIGNELNNIIPQINRKWFTLGVSIAALVMANIPFNVIDLHTFIERYHILIAFSFLGLLLSAWLIAKIRFMFKKEFGSS